MGEKRDRRRTGFASFKTRRLEKRGRLEMKANLSILGLVLLMSVLIVSGCSTSEAQSSELPPSNEAEHCTDRNTGAKMSYQQAVDAALKSGLVEQGQLKETHFCNEDTGTWWIDLDIEQPGCSPACVIKLSDGTAEINWRCTGALPPENAEENPQEAQESAEESDHVNDASDPAPAPVSAPDPRRARDLALTYIADNFDAGWPQGAPSPEMRWVEEDLTSEGLIGSTTLRYAAHSDLDTANWEITVSFPLVNPASTVYHVDALNPATGLRWEGEVDANGQVTELSVSTAPSGQPVVAWYGRVASLPAGAQYDDYLVVLPEGTAEVGIEGADEAIEAEILALRDKEEPGRNAHFWGTLLCEVPDFGGCQLLVSRLRLDGPGAVPDLDPIEGWVGTIYSGPPGPRSGGDDYFALAGGVNVQYGIDSAIAESGERELADALANLRDSGTIVRVWGQLMTGIPDWNGTRIQVSRFEIVEGSSAIVPPPPVWPEPDDGMEAYTNEDHGYQLRVPPVATITELGPVMFSPDEVPEGTTDEEYMAQLQEQYGDKLCVYIEYALGYIYISAPPNQGEGFRYYPCGLTGLGAGEIEQKTKEVTIAGQTYTAQGFEWIGDMAPCSPPRETLDCHNETMIIELEDGTRIEYGARYEPTATYADYLMKGKDMLRRIVASFEPTG